MVTLIVGGAPLKLVIGQKCYRIPLAILAAMGLHGCATMLPATVIADAAIDVPQSWRSNSTPITPNAAQYWRDLNDPLLTEFVTLAIANNLDIAQSAARLEQARQAVRSTQAGRVPQVSGSGGVRREVGDFANDALQFNSGIDASWEADLFGQISNSVSASRSDLAAAGYSLADVQRLVVGNVALQTISARAIAVQLGIARSTLANQEENLQIAKWRQQAGLVSSLDVEQARGQRAQTAASIPALESDLAATANAISTLIGEPPGRVLDLLEGSDHIPAPPETLGLGVPAEVLRRRPDVRAAEYALLSDTARIDVARAQLLPLVRLTGSLNSSGSGIDNLFDLVTGNVFASVSQLIFDGGRTRAQIGTAQAQADASLAGWRQTILRALEDVESSSVSLTTARQRLVLLEDARGAAENAAILARSQYQAGLIDFQIVLTSESQLLSARNSVATAEAQRASAFVRLTQALGGGWTPNDLTNTEEGAPQ